MIGVLERMAIALEAAKMGVFEGQMGHFPTIPKENTPKGSPKLEFAIQYLKDNPDFAKHPGAWLASNVTMPGDISMTRRTWNRAKQTVQESADAI